MVQSCAAILQGKGLKSHKGQLTHIKPLWYVVYNVSPKYYTEHTNFNNKKPDLHKSS